MAGGCGRGAGVELERILHMSARGQLAALRAGELSCEELMRATLARIAEVNPAVNAIVSLREEERLVSEARAADRAGTGGPLHGLPMAVKDLADVAGLPGSMGSPLFAGQVAEADSLFVARLRAAGAIFIGRTNAPEFGLGSHTFNPVFGVTRNPYDPTRSAGGSSGGAAVALACRMVALADGSDMMGSLRNPAGWNNVYGMRPSWGRVPDDPGDEAYLHPLATNGPMARSPGDLALLLEVMSGPDPRLPFCLPSEEFLSRLGAPAAGRRIGWLGDWGGAYPMEPGVIATCEAALAELAGIGLEVEAVAPPFPAKRLWHSWVALRAFANAQRLGPLCDDPAKRARLKPAVIWEVERGRALSVEEIAEASLIRSQWYARAAEMFARFDALVLPTAQVWPFPADEVHPQGIGGRVMDSYHRWMEVVVPASLIGLPVVAVPAGFGSPGSGPNEGREGLPMGLQLIGRHGDDAGLLQIAEAWHQATGWPDRRPPTL